MTEEIKISKLKSKKTGLVYDIEDATLTQRVETLENIDFKALIVQEVENQIEEKINSILEEEV